MSANVRKVSVSDAKPNMVLAKNVVAESGLILMVENTMLNERSIAKLRLYDISTIFIKELDLAGYDDSISSELDLNIISTYTYETNKVQFEKFMKSYILSETETKQVLNAISSGRNVEIGDLFSVTHNIMGTINSKSDFLSFMHHMMDSGTHVYSHSINVSLLCYLFGFWLGFKPDDIINLTVCGLLHDVGKIKISESIINKPGKLTANEFEEVKKHPKYGYDLLKNNEVCEEVRLGVLMHHEHVNGQGYPSGIKDDDIHEYAKIVAICDVYDAMTSNRTYRDKHSPFEVIKAFERRFYGHLDTKYLLMFLNNVAFNYIGSHVMLSTGDEAEVVFINNGSLGTPLVRMGNRFLDLSTNPEIIITRML